MRQQQVVYRTVPLQSIARVARLGDIALACVLLAISLPLMMIVAAAIKLDRAGPILDKQICIGAGGHRFHLFRFRTSQYDPRFARTLVGQFLWWTRIESLPQLINVLRGDMSILERDRNSPSFLD